MYVACLEESEVDSLRPSLETINTSLARRGNAGSRVPPSRRPPATYSPGAPGWTIPTRIEPQTTGYVVVVLETAAWQRLNPASRALFRELATAGYPPGFDDGAAVPWP